MTSHQGYSMKNRKEHPRSWQSVGFRTHRCEHLWVRIPPGTVSFFEFPPPPVLRDWVIKGLGMSSLVCATGHIKDPVPLIEKRRGLSPGGRFPPSFIHQVIIITGLNKLQLYVLALKMALDADRA